MLSRTWPYGSRLKARIISIVTQGKYRAVIAVDEKNEAQIMIGSDHKVEPVEGAGVVIEFTRGGARGGYWRIIANA